MKYVVVDLEMNPLSKEYIEERKQCKSEVIQIGAVALDERYQEIGSFKTLVKVRFNDAHNVAYVLVFKHFSPKGLIIIDQLYRKLRVFQTKEKHTFIERMLEE